MREDGLEVDLELQDGVNHVDSSVVKVGEDAAAVAEDGLEVDLRDDVDHVDLSCDGVDRVDFSVVIGDFFEDQSN